ncbi:MAG TPA: hypothetical protein VJ689_12940, partial [Gaiellaceae bacterium]|nr:hypothetical protein [Gaiellaceae bacterium]
MARRAALVILTAACLAAQASAAAPVRATLAVTSTTPAVGAPWRWTVRTTAAGKPAKATVKVQILLGGTVVGCWKDGKMQPCSGANAGDPIASRGVLSKPIAWTQASRDVALTFQAVVRAGGRT